MKLHKIISDFFLLNCFLFSFVSSVFAFDTNTDCETLPPDTPGYEDICSPPVDDPSDTGTDRQPANSDAGTPQTPSTTDQITDQVADKAVNAVKNKVKSGAKDQIKKLVFGDPAKVQAYSTKLRSEYEAQRQRCNAVVGRKEASTCAGPHPVCTDLQLQKACGREIPASQFNTLQDGAKQKIMGLAQSLAGKLEVDTGDILKDIQNQADTSCRNAWHLAKMTCQFPVKALGGKVTNALNVIGKVAFAGQAVAGLAGKSLNDLCKALTTLSGAGVTISMLARAKCAFAMRRCQRYCNMEKWSQPGYCNTLYAAAQSRCHSNHGIDWTARCAGVVITGVPPPVVYTSCTGDHTRMAQYACKVDHINNMKRQCGLLSMNTAKMFMDILQLIQTVRSAKMCWDKTGGNMSAPVSPEVCRQMGGEPYRDETTGEDRCRFPEPKKGEGKCPPYGVPVSCDQPCEDGSVPAGCPTGICTDEVVSCTQICSDGSVPTGCEDNTCPDPSLTYPNCDCNCPEGQTCNSDRQCVAGGGSCTSAADCADNEQCDPSGQCVPLVCADGSPNYPDCGCDNCPPGQLCNSDSGQCIPPERDTLDLEDQSCTSTADCEDNQVCQDGTCVPDDEDQSCTSTADCNEGQICQNGTCVPDGGRESCNTNNDCGPDKICQNGRCFCDCQGSPISCSEQCAGVCLEESVSCPCQGNGECTPPQKCVTSTSGQNVCSDDDGEGVCPDGSRVACDQNCPGGSKPANCRACNADSDCEANQICNRGACITEDPALSTDGAGGGGAPGSDLGEEDPLAIINDGMGGGDGSDGSNNNLGNRSKLPGASSGKQGKGFLGRLGALLGIKGGGTGGFRSGRRSGSQKGNQMAKGDAKSNTKKGAGAGGFGNYGAGGGGARSPAAGGFGLSAAQVKKLKKEKGNKRSAFPSNLGNVGGAHQDIFKAVTRRYQKIYKLK